MATYIVGYDLHEGEDYEPLIKAIKKLSGTWWHHLDSTWLIVCDGTAVAIRDALMPFLPRSKDRLLIADMGGTGAWIGFDDRASDWLKSNL